MKINIILGIDYGDKKIGFAIAEGPLAEPINVVRISSVEDGVEKVTRVVKKEQAQRIVIGISEGTSAKEATRFGNLLKEKLSLPVTYQDETLTTN